MIITHQHFKGLRYCNRGGRRFFKQHGLDWARFVREGIAEEKLLATGDAMAAALVAYGRR